MSASSIVNYSFIKMQTSSFSYIQHLEKATDPSMQEMDWSLVFAICDVVNNTEQGAKEARKLLQKKMLADQPQTQILALEVCNMGIVLAGSFFGGVEEEDGTPYTAG